MTFRGVFMNKLVQAIMRLAPFFPNGTCFDLLRNRISAVCLSGGIIRRDRSTRARTQMNSSRMSATNEWWKTNEEQKEREAAFCLAYAVVLIETDEIDDEWNTMLCLGFVMHAITLICIYQIKSILLSIDNE